MHSPRASHPPTDPWNASRFGRAPEFPGEAVAVGRIVEEDQHPRLGGALTLQSLVAMVAVLQEQPAVLVLGEKWRRFPSLFQTLCHLADVGFPVVLVDGHER